MSTLDLKEVTYDPTLAEDEEPIGLGALLGLIEDRERPLPLAQVQVRTTIVGDCCQSVMRQRFANSYDVPIEAVYIFPLPADGAITGLVLRIGEREIRAACRPREEAEKEFEKARREGKRGGLLTEERRDTYTIRVTNLPPREDVWVDIEWLERLTAVDGRFRWRLPTVIPPRYVPGTPTDLQGVGILPDTDRVPDASRLQPPVRLSGGTELDLEVTLHGRPTHLASSLHAVRLDIEDGPEPRVRIAPSARATLDRDFILSFSTAEAASCASRAWTDGQHTLLVMEPPADVAPPTLPRDAVFVIDVSGSMCGPKIEAAKRALQAAVHGLVAGDRFTIIAFDNRLYRFTEELCDYSQATLELADKFIAQLQGGGGTEMLPAIQAALEGETPAGRLRTILLITDAEVWNDAELARAVAERAPNQRLFTLGIDTALNVGLLAQLARLGGGTFDACTPDDDIETAVANLEARFGAPLVDQITVEGAAPARELPLVLYSGQPLALLLEGAPATITVRGVTTEGPWEIQVTPQPAPITLGPLWARERLVALADARAHGAQKAEELEAQMRELAIRYQISSPYTAWVAIDHQIATDGQPVEVVQPVELPYQWDESFREAYSDLGGPSVACALSAPRFAAFDGMLHSVTLKDMGSSQPVVTGRRARRPGAKPGDDVAAELARRQAADGSFGNDVARTAAALLALVLAGHTRHKGLRRRTVQKAAAWLAQHSHRAEAKLALEVLERLEQGAGPQEVLDQFGQELHELSKIGTEGSLLAKVLSSLSGQP